MLGTGVLGVDASMPPFVSLPPPSHTQIAAAIGAAILQKRRLRLGRPGKFVVR
jgi:hypothetical protein